MQKVVSNALELELDTPSVGRVKKRVKYYSAKRRAIYARGDEIDALKLFEMHNWMCSICNRKIDKRLRCPSRMAATIDHVTPLCKGGTHTWDNVAPAHKVCNEIKGQTLDLDLSIVL